MPTQGPLPSNDPEQGLVTLANEFFSGGCVGTRVFPNTSIRYLR